LGSRRLNVNKALNFTDYLIVLSEDFLIFPLETSKLEVTEEPFYNALTTVLQKKRAQVLMHRGLNETECETEINVQYVNTSAWVEISYSK
jgi:ATP-dependent Lon protease